MFRAHVWHRPVVRTFVAGLALAVAAGCGGGDEPPPAGETSAAAPAVAAGPESGEQLYLRCATCHQPDGKGLPGSFPPLAGSHYANAADPAVPISVVLHGMQGPLTIDGVDYNGVMPAYGTGIEMSDDEVAAVLTHVRSSWGNASGAVTAAQVAAERSAARTATGPVTAAELDARIP